MPRPEKYSDHQLREAVKVARSFRSVLQLLGLKEAGGNYQHVQAQAQRLKLDLSHLKGQSWRKGSTRPVVAPTPLVLLLKKNTTYRSSLLRQRLVLEGLKPHQCETCGLKHWQGAAIPLELDHINGDRHDNRIENLRLICPNCHALTPTYRGKNIGQLKKKLGNNELLP